MRILTPVLMGFVFLSLASCGRYHGHYGERYYQASDQSIAPIRVPSGVSSPVGQQLYPVPTHKANLHPSSVSLLPPDPMLHQYLQSTQSHGK